MELHYASYRGEEILGSVEQLALLRISVFYDFPYLYQGTMQYEAKYLERYALIPGSFVFTVWDGHHMVGATTGMPMKDEMKEISEPFLVAGINIDHMFYFGESVLLSEYRGKGIGHLFFDKREQYARSLGYKNTTFCSVIRAEDHPLKPVDYHSNDLFWTKRGYIQHPELICRLPWLDRGEKEETVKSLVFWQHSWK